MFPYKRSTFVVFTYPQRSAVVCNFLAIASNGVVRYSQPRYVADRLSAALNGFVGSDGLLLYRGLGDDKEVSGWDVGLSRSVETPESRVREFLFDGGFLRKSLSGGFRYEFGQPGFAFGYGGYRHPSSVCVSILTVFCRCSFRPFCCGSTVL